MPVIVACCTPFPLLICYLVHKLVKNKKNCKKTTADDSNEKFLMVKIEESN